MDVASDITLGGALLLASLLIGVVVAVETIIIISILTLPTVAAINRHLPWRRDAARRAEALLRSLVSVDEFASLCRHGYLDVPSPSRPERSYRIPRASGTIDVFEHGYYHSTLCVTPLTTVPDDDIVAAHRLMILGDEERYLTVANRVAGVAWEAPAHPQTYCRSTDQAALRRLIIGGLLAMAGALGLLQLANLPVAAAVVLGVVVGWPIAIAALSILAGLLFIACGALPHLWRPASLSPSHRRY